MTKSHDREGRRGRRTMYHGATRNGASVQLDDGRLMEKAGQGTTAPATMMAESGSATRPCRAVQCDSAGLHAGESVVCMGRWPSRRSAREEERHVLAAPAHGMISGRRPAILHGRHGASCVGGLQEEVHYPATIRVGASSIARSGADGGSNFGWRSSFGKGWKKRSEVGSCCATPTPSQQPSR